MSVLVLLLTPLVTVQPTIVKAQSSNQAPAIAWQQTYGAFFNGTGVQAVTNMVQGVAAVSNLIQTSDGGYVFMDEGWGSYGNFAPSIVFKVDSSGNINWTKAINNILGLAIKQTSDRGLEVSGYWDNSAFEYNLIKMDPQGNIESVRNYSSVPNLEVTPSLTSSLVDLDPSSVGKIRTSDDGFAYWTGGSIIKTDSNNNTQWVLNLNYTNPYGYATPLKVASVIETSDGALAIMGVGYEAVDIPMSGTIYLIKTEGFLPMPTNLPTLSIVIVSSGAVVIVVLSVVFYRRHRKTANSGSQETLT